MSYGTLVLGESGSGKTCSLRNIDPTKTLIIQPVKTASFQVNWLEVCSARN